MTKLSRRRNCTLFKFSVYNSLRVRPGLHSKLAVSTSLKFHSKLSDNRKFFELSVSDLKKQFPLSPAYFDTLTSQEVFYCLSELKRKLVKLKRRTAENLIKIYGEILRRCLLQKGKEKSEND